MTQYKAYVQTTGGEMIAVDEKEYNSVENALRASRQYATTLSEGSTTAVALRADIDPKPYVYKPRGGSYGEL